MSNEGNPGRSIGLMMLLAMAASMAGFLVVLPPAFADPGYLASAAAHAGRVRGGALLVLVPAALMLVIALAGWHTFRRHGERTALGLLALAAVALAVTIVEQCLLLAMLSLSQAYGAAGQAERTAFEAARVVAGQARYWLHYCSLFTSGVASLILYALLYRSRQLPRALPAFGVAAVALQLGVILLHMGGRPFDFNLVAPAGISQLATACWLLAVGLRPQAAAPYAGAGLV